MTKLDDIPEELIHRLWQEAHQKHGDGFKVRMDLHTLWSGIRSEIEKVNPVDLFWKLHCPELMTFNAGDIDVSLAPGLPEGTQRLVVDCLKHLQTRYKARYEPDESDSELKGFFNTLGGLTASASIQGTPIPQKLMQLVVYLHVVAARAFTMKQLQGDGLSEEILTCLTEAKETTDRLGRAGMNETNLHRTLFQVSSWAVATRVYVELSRFHRSNGDLSNALSHFAIAADFQDHMYSAMDSGLVENAWGSDPTDTASRSVPLHLKNVWDEESPGDLTPQEVVATFLSLKKTGGVEDWQRIRQCCQTLAECEVMFRQYDPDTDKYEVVERPGEGGVSGSNTPWTTALVEDEDGIEVTWGQFWYAAEAWVDTQLSPNEYMELQKQGQMRESEERLKNYFFGRTWNDLPESAQRRLVNADRTWCSKEFVAIESVLNELQRATQVACHEFVWQPLESNSSGGEEWLEFLKLKRELEDMGIEPGVPHYIRVCRSRYFETLLKHRKLNGRDTRFLTKGLPYEMRRLVDARNSAEHEHRVQWRRSDVAPYFRAFLGIGEPGVLPELARIGRRLRFRPND